MEINATIIGQIVTFGIFVACTRKWVVPAIHDNLQQREKKIAQGVQAAKDQQRALEQAKKQCEQLHKEAVDKANKYWQQTQKEVQDFLNQSRSQAEAERNRLIQAADQEIQRHRVNAEQALQKDTVEMACQIAKRLVKSELDEQRNRQIIEQWLKEQSNEQ
ncbi:F0F1 ATP synthase subunit B [Gammaproteobacteria bacterium]|nr:F0F1 ATP synthase subunit B [Gammaproteobacteria bacterium]